MVQFHLKIVFVDNKKYIAHNEIVGRAANVFQNQEEPALNHRIPVKQIMAFGALSAVMSFPAMAGSTAAQAVQSDKHQHSKIATAIDSRKAEYTIGKHLSLGGEICGTTEQNGHIWQPSAAINPQLLARSQSKAIQSQAGVADEAVSKYIIPVVFHVFGEAHNCDDDDGLCVTDEIVQDALQRTNEDFQNLNTLDGPIDPAFAAIRGKLNVEFVLAKTDSQGEPTSGIIRRGDESGHGNGGDNAAVMDNAWDNYKYMNIYIVNDLYGGGQLNNSGVAWFPSSDMSDKGLARVVYNGNYIGKNSNENFRSILTHEFGHWLNLGHVFSGNDCHSPGEAFCSTEGDKVCDTPQMSSSRVADNAPNCMGQATNTENFMHYTDNYAMFTEQQVERMTAALHHPARAPLWSNENLTATGLAEYIPVEDGGQLWDGITGSDQRPEGEILFEKTELSAAKDDVSVYQFTVPHGSKAMTVYLDGFSEDPDIYMSYGKAPTLSEEGVWDQEYVSFNSAATHEAIGVLAPTPGTYYVAVHAFSAYSNARLSVVNMEDTSTCGACEQVLVYQEKNLAALQGDEPKVFSVDIPDGAKQVSFELPGGYSGDPDLHVSHNSVPVIDSADCLPWKGPGVRERCEFRGENMGGTYNILINPFRDYNNTALTVHYTRVDPNSDAANSVPVAKSGRGYYALQGNTIEFSADGSNDIDGTIATYAWDFGDGNSSNIANPSHNYATYGQYTATLTITDDEGAVQTSQSSVLVGRPTAYCTASGNNEFDHIQNVKLGNLNNTSNAATVDGYQDFTALTANLIAGNHDLTVMGAGPLSGSPVENWTVWMDFNADGDFEDEGELVASFSAAGVTTQSIYVPEGLKGLTSTMRIAIQYEESILSACGHLASGEYEDYTFHINTDPIAQANGMYGGIVGQPVTFSSTGSTDAEGDINYLWDFGDGQTSTEANPNHTYASSGQFTATLTVTDSNGIVASDSSSVRVLPVSEPETGNSSGGSMGFVSALMLLLIGGRRRHRQTC